MNGTNYLLDTNIIIGLLNGNDAAVVILNNIDLDTCAYSAVTRMELLGFTNITEFEKQTITRLLNRMSHLSISEAIEEATIKFKQQYRVKLPDAIIAATAIVHSLKLLTLDKKLNNKF